MTDIWTVLKIFGNFFFFHNSINNSNNKNQRHLILYLEQTVKDHVALVSSEIE